MASHQHLTGTYSDTGDTQLVAVGYFVAPKLLLAIPAIRHLGLIHDIPGTYTMKGIELKVLPLPLRSKDVLKVTQSCLLGLAS